MTQLFVNNLDTSLSASLSDVATTVTLTDVAVVPSPTGGDYLLLTLQEGALTEIVALTARSGNTITITRAQEGTTARSWASGTRVFAGVTAGTLVALANGFDVSGAGANSIQIGTDAEARPQGGIAIGHVAFAEGGANPNAFNGIAIGTGAAVYGREGIALGDGARADGASSIVAGDRKSVV